MIKIVAVGDIMPGGILNKTDNKYVSPEIKEILKNGDIRVGTLETAIGNAPTFYEEKMNRKADVIYAEDDDLKRLVELDINIVSLANNHFFDLGPKGASHTISLLDKLGIRHIGAGNNLDEASQPVVMTIKDKTFAFLAFCDWRDETTGWCPFATENSAGINPMYDDYVVSEIQKYRPLYDYIIVIPHWGKEYDHKPTKDVYYTRNKMLEAGADLILGGHTHCVQPIINEKGKSTVFSMGNFLFPDRLICPPRSTYYPSSTINIKHLPITDGYPYVNEITYKIWKPMARLGMIAIAVFGENGVTTSAKYTQLTNDNVVISSELSLKYSRKLYIIEKLLLSKFYILFLGFFKYMSRIRMKFRR